MRRWLAVSVAAMLVTGCGVSPYVSGGPIGPTVQTRKPSHAQPRDPSPATGFEPGQILVKPAPGQTLDDLRRQFGAENVLPYRPEGMDDSLRLEFGLDDWVIILVPEGTELGALNGLIEEGIIVDSRLVPRGQGQRPI
ncbi:MAG: hypothetical protein RMM58_07850 [Chloroflexota bacterium]|nr:hypothetical protein [Dehalococcoidia bacterium]MDW8253774.1 hypothetical protein [Chloroflexota bacterium]